MSLKRVYAPHRRLRQRSSGDLAGKGRCAHQAVAVHLGGADHVDAGEKLLEGCVFEHGGVRVRLHCDQGVEALYSGLGGVDALVTDAMKSVEQEVKRQRRKQGKLPGGGGAGATRWDPPGSPFGAEMERPLPCARTVADRGPVKHTLRTL